MNIETSSLKMTVVAVQCFMDTGPGVCPRWPAVVGPDQLCRNPTSTKLNHAEAYCVHKRSMPNSEEPDLSYLLSFIALDGCSRWHSNKCNEDSIADLT